MSYASTPPPPSASPEAGASRAWASLCRHARAAGLHRVLALPRAVVEARLGATGAQCARWCPSWRTLVLLGDGGPQFWQRFRARTGALRAGTPDPLDAYTEREVERLADHLRAADPAVVTAYPFRHVRQVLGVQRLLAGTALDAGTPLGLGLDPVYGSWLAWRGLLLTALVPPAHPLPATAIPADTLPATVLPASPACAGCTAPCVAACPAGAVQRAGLMFERCAPRRLSDPGCQDACSARLACPAGALHRHGPIQQRFHARASLRDLRRYAGDAADSPS